VPAPVISQLRKPRASFLELRLAELGRIPHTLTPVNKGKKKGMTLRGLH
jgi:hypothetical protein